MRAPLFAVVLVGWLSACGGESPSVMEFVETVPAQPKLGDVTTVRFRLLDERGVPQAGTRVDFKLSSENKGVTLSPTSTTSLRGSGYAETQIVASARVNSVIVTATAGDKVVYSRPISFAGSVPHGIQFSFGCGPLAGPGSGGIHAIGAFDETRHLIVGDAIECAAHVGDRNGDGLANVQVSFLSEAGAIGPSEVSVTDLVGDAVVLYKTSFPLPVATEPDVFSWDPPGRADNDLNHTGDYLVPLWMHPFEWVDDPRTIISAAGGSPNPVVYTLREPNRTDPVRVNPDGSRPVNNPRDNLVTLIAVTSGEEGFEDKNNNGTFDSATETYFDTTEPFVDSNDNGTWDPNERYVDTNGDGSWTGKNNKWDANTLIWVSEKILWTGWPTAEDLIMNVPGVPDNRPVFIPIGAYSSSGGGSIDLKCPGMGSTCTQATPVSAYAFIADPWFNSIAQNGDSDHCEASAAGVKPPVSVTAEDGTGVRFTYPAGRLLNFTVTDVRDPEAAPIDQIPRRSPPVPFRANVFCDFTSARKDPYILHLGVGTLTGTIE